MLGRVDALVNNASLLGVRRPLAEYPADLWREVLEVNLTGTVALTRALLPGMADEGCIVNVTSGAAGRRRLGRVRGLQARARGGHRHAARGAGRPAHPLRRRQPGPGAHADARGGLPGRGSGHRAAPVHRGRAVPRHRRRCRPRPARSTPPSGRGDEADPAARDHRGLARRGPGPRRRAAGRRWPTSTRGCATSRATTADGLPGALPRGWVRGGWPSAWRGVAASLPDGHGLVVWDGYRPIATQAALYGAYLEELTMVHPDWPADALEEAAARYVTPPSRSLVAPPPHLTGGAVDLTLARRRRARDRARHRLRRLRPRGGHPRPRGRARPRARPAPHPLLGDARAGLHGVPRGVVALRLRRPVLGAGDRPARRSTGRRTPPPSRGPAPPARAAAARR